MFNTITTYFSNVIAPKLVLGTVLIFTSVISGVGVYKFVESLPEFRQSVLEAEDITSKDLEFNSNLVVSEAAETGNHSLIPDTSSSNDSELSLANVTLASNSSSQQTKSSNGAFSAYTLSLHNKANDCYVAYNGVVYSVTSHLSWVNCSHHGILGGRDITSIFPHSTSYFSTLSVVGSYDSGSTGIASGSTGTSGTTTSKGDSDKDDENESENEDESKESNNERKQNMNDIEPARDIKKHN